MGTTLTHLECSRCGKRHAHDRLQNLCDCGGPLLARYDLEKAASAFRVGLIPEPRERDRASFIRDFALATLRLRPTTMWRYAELLPGPFDCAPFDFAQGRQGKREPVTLGEGVTPLVHARRLGERLGLRKLYVKDEGLNPTGTFKARGLSAAVTRAKELGAHRLAIPTAGNAGGALAAYAARAGLGSVVVMPRDTPAANVLECRAFGAEVRQIDGLISDCGRYVAEQAKSEGWFEVSTFKEPYRVEGKKTMAFELWEQMGGRLPEVIVYPAGGGVGLIGMWKACEEMEALGWITPDRPRMVAVQAAGCAPVVEAFEKGGESCEFWENAATIASGLRVPKPLGDFLMLAALRASCGTAVTATDEEMLAAGRELAELEGVFAAPEGAATVVAARKLAREKWIAAEETVVLFNTGSGYKYGEAWQKALGVGNRRSNG